MSDLAGLIERVRVATGPDREIDCLIGEMTDLTVDGQAWRPIMAHGIDFAVGLASRYQSVWFTALPYYTSSIDAALGLAERLLPGFDYILEHTNGGLTISCMLGTADPDKRAWGNSIPLAIIAALLSALTSLQDTTHAK